MVNLKQVFILSNLNFVIQCLVSQSIPINGQSKLKRIRIMQDTGAEKKKKGKPAMGRWRVLRWIVGVLAVFVIVIVILAILGPTIGGTGQITQTRLNVEYVPTAEYLFNNPLPTPQ